MGVHSPEFAYEREREAVRDHARDHGLSFAQYLDNDHAYWEALHNEYWPALHLVDRCGRLRGVTVGEVHAGERSAERIEAWIETLLAERVEDCP